MSKITSTYTIKIYEGTFKNHCLNLSFTNAENDLLTLKKEDKSLNIIKSCFQTIIFYIRYHLNFCSINKDIKNYIDSDTTFIKNSSKININKSKDEYKIILLEYSEYLNGIVIKIKNDKKKLDYPKWKTLININIDQLTDQNKLIYNLYVLMPPRRIKDYINFVYVSNINNIIDQNNNYCFIDYENLNNSKFIFYNYKTFKTYGIQKLIISDDLLNFIIEYVKNQNIKDNEKFDIYGNIPYNIASPIIEWLLCDCYKKWNYAVFMVQSDFAKRLIAKPNTEDYSSLTLFANFMSDIKLEYNVSKEVFYPIPNVESSIISIVPKDIDFQILNIFKSVSKTLFHNRRKNIKNNFIVSPYINIEKDKIDEVLEKANIDKNDRGESLSLEEVKKLANIIKEYI